MPEMLYSPTFLVVWEEAPKGLQEWKDLLDEAWNNKCLVLTNLGCCVADVIEFWEDFAIVVNTFPTIFHRNDRILVKRQDITHVLSVPKPVSSQ